MMSEGTVVQIPGPAITELPSPSSSQANPPRVRSVAPVVGLIVVTVLCALLDGLYANTAWSIAGLVLTLPLAALCLNGTPSWSRSTWVVLVSFAGLALLAALSMTWSVAPSRSWIEANRLALYLAYVLILLALLRTPDQRRAAIAAVGIAVGVLLAGTFIAGLLGTPASLFLTKRLHAPIEYINGVAGLAAIAFWPAVSLAENPRRPTLAAIGAACASISLSAIVLTQSRSVAPALLVSGVLVLGLLPGRRYRVIALSGIGLSAALAAPFTFKVFSTAGGGPERLTSNSAATSALLAALVAAAVIGVAWRFVAKWANERETTAREAARKASLVIAVVAAIGALVATPSILNASKTAFDQFTTLSADEPTALRFTSGGGNRHELWRVAVEEWKDAPVLGIGAGGYGVRWYQERRITEAIRQPHSLPLQVLAELGLLGALLLAITIGGVVAASVRAVKRADADSRAVLAGAIGALTAWFTHTSLDWLHNLPAITGLALVGLAVILAEASVGTPAISRRRLGPIRWVAVGALAIATASFGMQLAVDAYSSRASRELATDPEAAKRTATRATRLDNGSVRAWTLVAAAEARLGSYDRADAALRRAIAAEPESYVGYTLRGDLAKRAGYDALAQEQYEKALSLNPLDPGLQALVAPPAAPAP